jgi:hypothetical protein
MPLTQNEVTALQATQSTYGCGASDCKACYPIQYSCESCYEEFPAPIANGERFTCPACDYTEDRNE